MVLLTATSQILETLSTLPPSAISDLSSLTLTATATATATSDVAANVTVDGNLAYPDPPLPTLLGDPISHHTLIALSRLRLKHGSQYKPPLLSLNTLLRGTRLYTPPAPSKPAPTPEYTALMTRLREQRDAEEYMRLLKNKQRSGAISLGYDEEQEQQQAEDNISPSLVLNILLSVVMCAVAMFQMTKWWPNDGVRVLASLGVGLVVGIAEVGVYSIYLMKVKQAQQKERKKKEIKTVIGEFVSSPLEDGAEDQTTRNGVSRGTVTDVAKVIEEKEMIWGKGVNGGIRRRVIEKWEKEQQQEEQHQQ